MAKHEQSAGKTDEWYTPSHVFQALGCIFDDDVASPGGHLTQWIPAKRFITRDSLSMVWKGLVWMNSPFGGRNGLVPWLDKFFEHGNGIALVPDRTSAPWWQQFAPKSDLALFISPKLKFIGGEEAQLLGLVDRAGDPGDSPAQGTCLLGSGRHAAEALRRAASEGLGVLFRPVSSNDGVSK
jgi:hypothetical protein